jgi:hypothetical protein
MYMPQHMPISRQTVPVKKNAADTLGMKQPPWLKLPFWNLTR